MPAEDVETRTTAAVPYTVRYRDGTSIKHGDGPAAFTISVADEQQLRKFLTADDYSAALAFLRGEFDVSGDLFAALRFKQSHSRRGWRHWLYAWAAKWVPRIESWWQSKDRAASNIQFHYDRSNAFYRLFLDSRMVYSDGYFDPPGCSLDEAQEAKLDGLCRELDLRPGDRFLDVGCGWGGLIFHAAGRYGVSATGCTLSAEQHKFVGEAIAERGLSGRVAVELADYRDLSGTFDKIASVGMFEHVGRRRLGTYFRKIHALLAAGGRFVNTGITRPQPAKDDRQSGFVADRVFPGGELAHLSAVVREAENAGFEILRIEQRREHYGRTCRAWVANLQRNEREAIALVGRETYRTWLLYLAGSAWNFAAGHLGTEQVLMGRR